jgi:predicted nucleic acid-binding protein
MIVVSDASPIIALSLIGQLNLLKELYHEVEVPEAVYHEITQLGDDQTGVQEILRANWISVRPINNNVLVNALLGELDQGEAEAIVLATEIDAELLLIDERRGRKAATRLGLNVIGVLGILIEAKKKKLIHSLAQQLGDLVLIAGFRISQTLHRKVLDVAQDLDNE